MILSGRAVIDASALLVVLNGEPGEGQVIPLLPDAVMSAVNWSEVVQKALARGVAARPEDLRADVEALGVEFEPFTADRAEAAAALWPLTRQAGLSLGDRACLALAVELDATAVTADREWAQLTLPVPIRLVR